MIKIIYFIKNNLGMILAGAAMIVLGLAFSFYVFLYTGITRENLPEELVYEDTSTAISLDEKPGEPEEETETEEPFEVPEEYMIENFELILQKPELPTGCEIVSATMVLNYLGFNVDKTVMASKYLPKISSKTLTTGSDGLLYGPDLYNFFLGDPASHGYICGPGAIVTAVNDYLADEKSELIAYDMAGASFEDLYGWVSRNIPVIVWVTIALAERRISETWYSADGHFQKWGDIDHCAVLIGYTEDTVTIADPVDGIVTYKRGRFEEIFKSRNFWCVIIK